MATEILRPNAAGDETNLTPYAAGSNYQQVDEASPDDETTNVYPNPSGWLRDFYNLDNHSVGSGTINKITVYCEIRGSKVTSHSAKIAIKSGTGSGNPDTISEGSQINLPSNTAYNSYNYEWTTNPATSSAWTWDEIDHLQAGVSMIDNGIGRPACTQVYVEVDYTAMTPKASSDSGAGTETLSVGGLTGINTKTDIGAGVDALSSIIAALIFGDTGSGIDNASLAKLFVSSDSGIGSDAIGSLGASIIAAETGSGIEAYIFTYKDITSPDIGAGSDAISLLGKQYSDAGAAVDTIAGKLMQGLADYGIGIESITVEIAITSSETGSGVDSIVLHLAIISDSDSGSGTDGIAEMLATILASDSGSGAEVISDFGRICLDAGVGIDAISRWILLGDILQSLQFTPYSQQAIELEDHLQCVITSEDILQNSLSIEELLDESESTNEHLKIDMEFGES